MSVTGIAQLNAFCLGIECVGRRKLVLAQVFRCHCGGFLIVVAAVANLQWNIHSFIVTLKL